jgi:hypothetical protein
VTDTSVSGPTGTHKLDTGWRSATLAVLLASVLSGCYADGNSRYLAAGETRLFLTMAACEKEATATYTSGGPVYSGFQCRSRFVGFLVETRDYEEGKRIR